MSAPASEPYKLDHGDGVPKQIDAIKTAAKKVGHYRRFVAIMKEAICRLETDPHGWGDPEYRSKVVDAVACHALIRPVVFKYIVYEQLHGVVLVSVKLYADFAEQ